LVRTVLSSEENLTGFINLECSDLTVGGINWNLDLLAILLLSGHFFNVDAPTSAIDSKNFAGNTFTTEFRTSLLNENGVSLSDGH
jgi:hypothetical protein